MDISAVLGSLGFDFKVFVFNLVNFLILALLLKKFLFTKVSKTISEREQIISDGVRKNEESFEVLEKAKVSSDQIISESRKEATQIIQAAADDATQVADQIKDEAHREADSIVEKAKQHIESDKKAALDDIRKEAAKIVVDSVADRIAATSVK